MGAKLWRGVCEVGTGKEMEMEGFMRCQRICRMTVLCALLGGKGGGVVLWD